MSAAVLAGQSHQAGTAAGTIDPEQRTAAKVVGFIYLIAMATAIFAELYVRGPLIAGSDAVKTAMNIAASERLFRLSTVIHVITFASDAAIGVALYVVLRPVNRNLALLAAFWRLADCAILAAIMVNDFAVLRLLSGAEYLRVFDTPQLQALARLFLSVEAAGFQVGFVMLGLGSTLFSYLWLRSGYIPRAIAAWGIFASMVLAFGTLAIMLFPPLSVVGMGYMAPMFFYEVGLGLWLLVRGLRAPAVRAV
ncbi:MAG TPA: DUF4386 domain-containing protein [Thermoanaerobaculia bacterium]|nr:DUF4386 domain-containing protein [Thermoanaerobaculia bacterium]